MEKIKVVVIATHPVIYHVDFYKLLQKIEDIDFSVVFFDVPGQSGENELSVNLEGVDVNKALYDGYTSTTLKNYSVFPKNFFCFCAPTLQSSIMAIHSSKNK